MMRNGSNGVLTIGQAAEAVGAAASALRYYERRGLLVPSSRSDAGYRVYTPDDVDHLRFIRSAQAVGFTLDDIRTLLDARADGSAACRTQVQPLLERRLADVDEKMKDLRRVRTTLARALDRCRRSRGGCPVLKEISPTKVKRRP